MRKLLLIGGLLVTSAQLIAQSIAPTDTKNYIYTKNCLDADCIKKAETVQYFDGLGRPKQIVAVKASPTQKDVVGHIEYDADGRISKSYLPVPQTGTQNGAIYENPLNNATNPEIYGAEKIYSKQVLENLPLARVKETYNLGNAWSDKPVTYSYKTNTSATEVKKYGITTTWIENRTDSQLSFSAYYPVNSLMKTSATDEDGNTTIEYKNGKGQPVLIRKNDGTHDLDTYYVYNEYSQLAFIIPPLASVLTAIDEAKRNSLCYQYRYDEFGRLVEKRIPGKGWEYLVYDRQDRVVLTQDAMLENTTNNFAKKGWMFTKYDKFGRVVYTGFFANTASRLAMQTALNNMSANAGNNEERSTTPFALNGMDVYYTKNAFPTGSMTILSVNYYDTYPPLSSGINIPTQILGKDVLTQDVESSSVNTKTLPTASYVKNIENDNWTQMYSFYDQKGRTIGVYSINHLGGYTKTETEVDFLGITQRSVTKHKRVSTDAERIISETFEYDSQDRLLTHKHQVDGNPLEILSQNTYNELSQVKNKKVGGTSAANPLQDINYTYNIRGWTTKINDPKNLNGKLFGYEIKYNQVEGLQTPNTEYNDLQVKPRFNGNIAEVDWKTQTIANDNLRRYGYVYDNANRLSAGFYQKDDNPSAQEYYEKIDYDFNGNITHLKRTGAKGNETVAAAIDNLTYDYAGNSLNTVNDTSGNYNGYPDTSGSVISYDANGNMKDHTDKGVLQIDYNFLNLPDYIKFDKGLPTRTGIINENIYFTYRADGTKVRKIYNYSPPADPLGMATSLLSKTTEYLDGFQYETLASKKPSTNFILKFVPTAEGYYNFENNKYIYSYTDHLGNVRLSYYRNANGSAEVLEENNYYPFGMKHEGYNVLAGNPSNHYGYNGHELQKETGWNDFGFRQYMSDIGRFGAIDPLADTTLQPYSFASNNPVLFVDFMGLKSTPPLDSSGYSNGQVWTDGEGWWQRVDGGWKNTKNDESAVDEIIVGGGNVGGNGFSLASLISGAILSLGDNVNNMLTSTFFGLSSSQSMGNYQKNLSNFQIAVNNSKAAKSTEEAEQFLFLELPASFMGGELLSVGWRAAGMSRFICKPLGNLSKGLIKLCFTEGTLVATEKGSKKIEDIKEGDLVWSYNEETGKKELKKVVALSRNTSSSLVKISVNGTEITCTPEHPFYVNGSWIEAKDLTKGMLLTSLDEKTSPIEFIIFLDEKVKVYNFEIEGNHNYYVSENNILVHNDCGVGAIIDSMPSSLKRLNMCKQFTAELMERMASQGMKGEMVILKSQTRGIWSNTFNGTITDTGEHVAVKVGNIVYDNLFPKGIEYSKWLMDLEVGSWVLPPPTIVPF